MATASQLQQLYVAYFGRAADPSGIDYWVSKGTTTKEFAAHMHGQNEFQATYGSKSVASQVNQIYQNLFGRDGDAAGLIYWETQINNGTLALASIANDLIYAVNNGSSATDLTALTNKTDAATSYTAALRLDADALIAYQPTATSPWASGDGLTEGVTFISSATATNAPSSTDVSTSISTVAALNLVGSSFDYTTASAGDKFTGTTKNDTFTGTHLTFEAGDETKGGAGTGDKLVFRNSDADATADTLQPVVLDGVETIQVQNIGGAAFTMNLLSATGVTDVNSYSSTGNVDFANVQSLASATIDNSDIVFRAGYKDGLAGTASTFTATLKGGSVISELQVSEEDASEFGIFSFTSSGSTANAVTLINDDAGIAVGDLVTVNISGAAPFTFGTGITAGAGAGTTIDASTATGNLTITGVNFETVTLGSGDDILKLGATQISQTSAASKVNYNGGAGTDTLALGAQDLSSSGFLNGAATSTDVVTNFETLTATGSVGTASDLDVARGIDANTIAGITTIKVELDNNDTATSNSGSGEDLTLTVSDLLAGQVVQVSGFSNNGSNAAAIADSDINVTLDMDSPTGSSDTVTFQSVASSASTAHVNNFDTLTVNTTSVSSTTERVEVLEINSSRAVVSSTVGTTIGAVAAANTATINITGAKNIDIGTIESYDSSTADTTVTTIDASAFTGDLNLGTSGTDFMATAADDVTLKLGSGTNKVYTGSDLGSGDTIIGSVGSSDTLYLTGGFTAPAAVTDIETLALTSGSSTSNALDKFTGYTTIDITNGTNTHGITKVLDTGVTIKSDDIHTGTTLTVDKTTAGGTLAFELDTTTTTDGTLSTNATTLDLTMSGTSSAGDFASDTLIVAGSVTSINLSGGGETNSAGTYSTMSLEGSGSIGAITSTYDGSLTVSALGWNTSNGATVTTGANTVASTTTVDDADIINGVVKLVDTAGTDTLLAATTGEAFGLIDVTGYETINFDVNSNAATSVNLRDVSGATTVVWDGTSSAADDLSNNITVTSMMSGATTKIGGALANSKTLSTTARTGSTADTHVLTTAGANFTSAGASTAVTFNGFETFTIQAGADHIDIASNDASLTLGSTTTLNLGGDIVNTSDDGNIALGTVVATSLETISITSEGGTVSVADLGTTDSLETFTIAAGASQLVTVTDFDSTSLDLITLTGESVTLTGADAGSLDHVDGSALTGTLTVGSGFTTAAGGKISGGTAVAAVDAISMTTTNVKNLVLGANGTAETGDDSLTLSGAMNSGTGTINLSLSTDQITKLNGVDDSVVQTGINDVIVSSVTSTGSHGFHITAAATGSLITGSIYNDTIVLGDASDEVTFNAYVAGVTDTITGFTAGTGSTKDTLDINAITTATAFHATLTAANANHGIAANEVYLILAQTAGDADNKTDSATAINAAANWTLSAKATDFIVVDDDSAAIYRFTETADDTTVTAAELNLIATVDAVLVGGNVAFA